MKAHREQSMLGALSDFSLPQHKTTKPRALGIATGSVGPRCNRATYPPAGAGLLTPPSPSSASSPLHPLPSSLEVP